MNNEKDTVRIPVTTIAAKVIKKLNEAVKKSPTGVSFARVNGYTNSSGEKSNVTINIGVNYGNVKEKDLKYLQNLDVNTLVRESNDEKEIIGLDKELLIEAKEALLKPYINPKQETTNRSKAQSDAYTRIEGAPQLKVHNDTGLIYLEGYQVSKTILLEGEYKKVKSRPLTIAKKEIKKGMKVSKIRQYKLDGINNLSISGDTIEFIEQSI